jgi:hypothetical protein
MYKKLVKREKKHLEYDRIRYGKLRSIQEKIIMPFKKEDIYLDSK